MLILSNKNEVEIVCGLVDQILALKEQKKDADVKTLEAKIDRLVYQLYELTEEEIKIVAGEHGAKRESE